MTDQSYEATNVVLVHGAYADGSSWADVIPFLQERGLRVTAVQNSLTSLKDDVAATTRALDQQPGPTILVGHSWAGTVISQAGSHSSVAALVFIAARAPDAGEDYSALAAQFPAPPASKGLTFENGFGGLSESAFLDHFANGIDPRRARVLFAVQGQVSEQLFGSRTTHAAWHDHPCWYAVSTHDETTAPELERFLADRMNATTIELASGHLSMISHPQEVADLILRAARFRTEGN